MMNTASRDPFVHRADAAYDDHIKKQGQAPNNCVLIIVIVVKRFFFKKDKLSGA